LLLVIVRHGCVERRIGSEGEVERRWRTALGRLGRDAAEGHAHGMDRRGTWSDTHKGIGRVHASSIFARKGIRPAYGGHQLMPRYIGPSK
jgi:hypothetical protein